MTERTFRAGVRCAEMGGDAPPRTTLDFTDAWVRARVAHEAPRRWRAQAERLARAPDSTPALQFVARFVSERLGNDAETEGPLWSGLSHDAEAVLDRIGAFAIGVGLQRANERAFRRGMAALHPDLRPLAVEGRGAEVGAPVVTIVRDAWAHLRSEPDDGVTASHSLALFVLAFHLHRRPTSLAELTRLVGGARGRAVARFVRMTRASSRREHAEEVGAIIRAALTEDV